MSAIRFPILTSCVVSDLRAATSLNELARGYVSLRPDTGGDLQLASSRNIRRRGTRPGLSRSGSAHERVCDGLEVSRTFSGLVLHHPLWRLTGGPSHNRHYREEREGNLLAKRRRHETAASPAANKASRIPLLLEFGVHTLCCTVILLNASLQDCSMYAHEITHERSTDRRRVAPAAN